MDSPRVNLSAAWTGLAQRRPQGSLCHRSLLQFIQAHTPEGCHHEALRLTQVVLRPQLHFFWQKFQWNMGQPSGVQQGHSHSAIPFAFVVGHLLEDLFKKWRDRGEHTTTRDCGWLFVDDLLCSFDSWAQARVLVPEIVEAFGRAGLRVSLKQSEVLCTLQTLEEGRALDWEPDEFLFSIPWTSCTKYLRKPLTHLKVAESTYTVLLPIMKQRVHLAREQLRQVVKGLRWHQPYLAMRLVDRYVGATFFWYLPTCSLQLLPYRRFSRSKFQSWSSCCGRSFLNMSVMLLQCFCTDSASLLSLCRNFC